MTESGCEWKTVYESVIGTSHESNGNPCQDCCRVLTHSSKNGETLIAVCADGAGSAEYSDEGSQLACDTWIELCRNFLDDEGSIEDIEEELILSWLEQIRESIVSKAVEYEISARDMATTLLGCLVFQDSSLFVQIGDGAMLYRDDDSFAYAFWPHSGEYANMTNFLTSEDYAEKYEWKIVDFRIEELVAFTDGLERLILRFEDQTIHEPAITPMLAAIRKSESSDEFFKPLREFLSCTGVNERTDDDKTLILATRMTHDEAVV